MLIQQIELKIPYRPSAVCNWLKFRITLPACEINNKRDMTSQWCFILRIERKVVKISCFKTETFKSYWKKVHNKMNIKLDLHLISRDTTLRKSYKPTDQHA